MNLIKFMFDWYTLAIIALFSYGIQNFLYKVSAERKCNSAWTTFSFMITVAVLSTALFFIFQEKVTKLYLLLPLSLVNAIGFLITTIAKIEALKNISANIAFPIIRMSAVLVVIFSVIYFKDSLSPAQIIGIILAILVIYILTTQNHKEKEDQKNFKLGIILAFIALLFSALTTIAVKFAAITVSILGFIAISYIFNSFFSLGLRKKLQTEKENPNQKNALIIGFFIGLFNFIGFYIILKALTIGPLSIVASINSLSFVIAIILSVLIYKEKMTSKRIIGVLLAILAVILMKV